MIKKYIYIIGIGSSLLLSGCSNNVMQPEADTDLVPILLNSSGMSVSTGEEALTRVATTAFPNAGSIAIVAAKTNAETPSGVDWSDGNLYLNHLAATAGTGTKTEAVTTTTYPIAFSPVQYYSFNADEYLQFVAYSPASHAAMTHANTTNSTELTVKVSSTNKTFPDLLYTNPTTKAYNKVTGKSGVLLGEFKHAMAKLVIKITPVDATSGNEVTGDPIKDFKITKLNVLTKVTEGNFNLNATAPTWALTAPAESVDYIAVNTLVSSDTALPYNNEEASECYLFPATEDVNTVELSAIEFALKDDKINAVDETYTIDRFQENGTSVQLEMGKTTVLTIKVKVTTIQAGTDTSTTLEGTLKDWIYKGNSNVTIE